MTQVSTCFTLFIGYLRLGYIHMTPRRLWYYELLINCVFLQDFVTSIFRQLLQLLEKESNFDSSPELKEFPEI